MITDQVSETLALIQKIDDMTDGALKKISISELHGGRVGLNLWFEFEPELEA